MRRSIPVWVLVAGWFLPVWAETTAVDLGELRKGLGEIGERLMQLSSKLGPAAAAEGSVSSSASPKEGIGEKAGLTDAERALTIAEHKVEALEPTEPELKQKGKTKKARISRSRKRTEKKKAKAPETVTEKKPTEPEGPTAEKIEPLKETPEKKGAKESPKKGSETSAELPGEAAPAEKKEQEATPEEKGEPASAPATSEVAPAETASQAALRVSEKGQIKRAPQGTVQSGLKVQDIDDERIKAKMRRIEKLVTDAAVFFKKTSVGRACRSFEQDREWHAGDLYITVFNDTGALLVDGHFAQRLWDDFLIPSRDELTGLIVNDSFVAKMLEFGDEGGWLSYDWNFGIRFAFAKLVKKQGLTYIITAGFYPDSPRFEIQQLVKRAIGYGERVGAHQLFKQINNPRGSFVRGDLYLEAYDFEGFAYAHGHNLVFVGQNRIEWRDSTGFKRNRRMIQVAEREGKGWLDYMEEDMPKTAYFEAFIDPRSGRRYIVVGGYYPTIDDDTVINFVKRAVEYLKENGADVALRDFSSYTGKFVQGPLHIFTYAPDGVMLADSENPIFIGQNLIKNKDSEGVSLVVNILNSVRNERASGWVTFKDKGAYRAVYCEYVEVPDGKFIIGSGYWPTSKDYLARSIAKKGVGALKSLELPEAIRKFLTPTNEWIHGDIYIRVYSPDGICLVSGPDRARIWHDELKHLDEKGYPVFKQILAIARGGGGPLEYPMYGYKYRAYVYLVEKPLTPEEREARAVERREARRLENKKSRLKVVGDFEDTESLLNEQYVLSVGYYL